MDQRIRKLMTMHKALHPRDKGYRLYASRKEGKGLAIIEDRVDALIQRLEDYIEKRGGSHQEKTDNTRINRMEITRKQKLEGKQQKLLEQYKKCIAAGGDYFERD